MHKKHFVTGFLGLLGLSLAVLIGCQTSATQPASTVSPGFLSQEGGGASRGAAEIWSTTCSHCHNSRSPASYSDAQWEVAMLHMRVQANLTVEEYRTIRDFLLASN